MENIKRGIIMETKQTAVEWLVEQLARKHNEFQALTFYYDHKDEIEQAKQMEKEQMIDFLDSIMDYTKESHNILGVSDDREAKDYFEQYYNEIYGN